MRAGETQMTMDMGGLAAALKAQPGAPAAADLDMEMRIVDGKIATCTWAHWRGC